MKEFEYFGEVENGRLRLGDGEKSLMMNEITTLEGRKVSLRIQEVKNLRSLLQNKYYWGVIIKSLVELTGYTKEEMHEILKYKFLKKDDIELEAAKEDGAIPITKSTSELNTVEFENFVAGVRAWASLKLGLYIPKPNETKYNYLGEKC